MFARQRPTLRRHSLIFVRRLDPANQLAPCGIARLDRLTSGISSTQCPRTDIEAQPTLLLVRPMTLDAAIQNGPHLLNEVDPRRVRQDRRAEHDKSDDNQPDG